MKQRAEHEFALVGVDTGGTFTDFVCYDNKGDTIIHKVLSTPHAPEQAILTGLSDLGLKPHNLSRITHGSTVATNALLERKGVPTVYVTNHGFRDVLLIGRQARRELYNLTPDNSQLPIQRANCLETGGRLGADGTVLEPLTEQDKQALLQQLKELKPQAVAINLLFSYLDDDFEKQLQELLQDKYFVSRSSEVLAEYREYERGMVTWINAWLGPLVQAYLRRLHRAVQPAPLSVMQSSGGTISADVAGRFAVNLLLSGPAGGLLGAQHVAQLSGRRRIMTVDMGGTSTDVALIENDIRLTNRGEIDGFPVAVPMVDMHTIGAGGGSLAYRDEGGLLQVGPESAGAMPGPACYDNGGTQATVTDANLLLGRILPDAFLGGKMRLQQRAARKAITELARSLGMDEQTTARGIIRVANEHMVAALRVISVQRGLDPRDFTLVPFGGAGGLHVCALADALEMQTILLPVHGGVLSALGMVVSPQSRQASRTYTSELDDSLVIPLEKQLSRMDRDLREELEQELESGVTISSHWSVDLRYAGQSFSINCVWSNNSAELAESFHQEHEKLYGHRLQQSVEVVNLRVRVATPSLQMQLQTATQQGADESIRMALQASTIPAFWRAQLSSQSELQGPCLLVETVATSYIAEGWAGRVDPVGNVILEKQRVH